MKSFKKLHEEVTLPETDAISDVVTFLEAIQENSYDTLNEALEDVSKSVETLGLSFDIKEAIAALEEGDSIELSLNDSNGDDVGISVFKDESIEEKVEGDLFLKITKLSEGKINPEILVYFEEGKVESLSDVDFEVSMDEESDDDYEETVEDELDEVNSQIEDVLEQMEEIQKDGGIVPMNDPLMKKLRSLKATKNAIMDRMDEDLNEAEEEPETKADPVETPEGEEEPVEEAGYEKHLKKAVESRMKDLEMDADEEKLLYTVDSLMAELDSILETPIEVQDEPVSDSPEEKPVEDEEESAVEVYEEKEEEMPMFNDTPQWNVILLKIKNRHTISKIFHAKSEKELTKIIEKDYPEYIVYSISPVELFTQKEK